MLENLSTFHALNSSMCDACALDGTDLLVRFTAGKVYRYLGAAERYSALIAAESAGKYVNASLKPNYHVERVLEHE